MKWAKHSDWVMLSDCGAYSVTKCNDPINDGATIYGAWKRAKRDKSGKLKDRAIDLGQRFATVLEAQTACERDAAR